MSAARLYQPRRRKLSLTALIDVVFILLMFFMLTSSFDQWRAVDLQTEPKSSATNQKNLQQDAQYLYLSATGDLQLREAEAVKASITSLTPLLNLIDGKRPLILLPEETARVQLLVMALDEFKNAGLSRVTLGEVVPASRDAY
ncbi:ExbD/TolR family protein [Teredinibacter waterburyi]|uniref:ExbD/TolR family protein n=1 Tax=Teredinibacter waterburyi TaxID=1500538 RepID=UPI00165F290C|nr:biopolymer transporter ExbD [Teredinibacter waterburyi]